MTHPYETQKSREGLIEKVYACLETNTPLDTLHIPHSDVFFVREALEHRFDAEFSLEQVEEYMRDAGWTDAKHSVRQLNEQDSEDVYSRTSQEQDERAWLEWREQTKEDSFT